MTNIFNLKKKLFPRGIRRDTVRIRSRVAHRTYTVDFVNAFRKLDIPTGSVVCIHARLSSFGYLADGIQSVIRALQYVVPDVTILMPTFPFVGSMKEYVESNPVFDAAKTPSASGLLSEEFRKMPHVLRGMHPTHPSAALGPKSQTLIKKTEHSETPFGDHSAYGRCSMEPKAFQLLLNTNSTSIVHVIQELIDMPNLFMKDKKYVKYIDNNMNIKSTLVKVHFPKLPLYIAVPSSKQSSYQYIWMPDYCVLFPTYNKQKILNSIKNCTIRNYLENRDLEFYKQEIFRKANINDSEILAIEVSPWLQYLCDELSENINAHAKAYKYENISL